MSASKSGWSFLKRMNSVAEQTRLPQKSRRTCLDGETQTDHECTSLAGNEKGRPFFENLFR